MNDKGRVDAFMERLTKDPELAVIALALAPQRIFMDDTAIVYFIEAAIAHWQATAPQEIKQ